MARGFARLIALAFGAVASGAFVALLFPPWGAVWLAPAVLFPALGLLGRVRSISGGAVFGALFGLGFVVGYGNWVYASAHEAFGLRHLMSGLVSSGAALLAAWPFAVFGAGTVALRRGRLPAALAPAVAWVAAEWCRVHAPEPLPWLRLGDALYAHPNLLQPAELGGVALLSFLLVLLNGLLFEAIRRGRAGGRGPLAAALVIALLWVGAGAWRLSHWPGPGPGLRVALVHTAALTAERNDPAAMKQDLARHLELTGEAVREGAQLVLWSETALAFVPEEAPPDLDGRIAAALGFDPDRRLLMGALLRVEGGLANGVSLRDGTGRELARYSKQLLVPVVESIPAWLERRPRLRQRLKRFAATESYVAGSGSRPLLAGDTRLGVLICYETMLPDLARAAVDQGADLLVNPSNDAHFPDRGAEQHQVMAVMRAVELRRPIVRVANRGVSLVVDAGGRVRERVDRNERGFTVATVHPEQGASPYVRGGHLWDEASWLLFAWGCLPRRKSQSGAATRPARLPKKLPSPRASPLL